MANVKTLMTELAELDPAGPPIVTLYLDTWWSDEQQRRRVALFFEDRARQARQIFANGSPAAQSIERTLELLERQVDLIVNRDVYESAGGIMLVASADRGIYEELAIPEPFEPGMFVESTPVLGPLVETLARIRPALLATLDSSGVDIFRWELGGIVEERSLERDVPNRHKMGGWSQRRYQQHVAEHIRGVWRECADFLTQMADANPRADIVLFGQEPNLRAFMNLLPERSAERVVAMLPAPPPQERQRMVDIARRALRRHRREQHFETVHHLLRQGLSDRSGVLGTEDTLLASNERRIRMITLSPRFVSRGFLCAQCQAAWTSGATGCVFCGGPTRVVSLREELLRRCILENVDLVGVREGGPLDAYQGIGALLRRLSGEEWQRLGRMGAVRGSFIEAPLPPG